MYLQLSEPISIKESRLEELSLIEMEISKLEKKLYELKKNIRDIEEDDTDYKKYKSSFNSYEHVDYGTYCNLIKIFNSTNDNELLLKFNSYFQVNNLNIVNNITSKPELEIEHFEIWNKALENMKKELTEISYNTWIKTIKFISEENDVITLGVPSEFNLGIIESRYLSLIKNSIKLSTNKKYKIKIQLNK